jgi:hypothetical protein
VLPWGKGMAPRKFKEINCGGRTTAPPKPRAKQQIGSFLICKLLPKLMQRCADSLAHFGIPSGFGSSLDEAAKLLSRKRREIDSAVGE